jgi:hypothetical protein
MIFARRQNLVRSCALLGAILTTVGGAALLGGCKGNTSAAASVERRTGRPPVVVARAAGDSGDIGRTDPLSDQVWRGAEWWPLVAPANTAHTTPASRTAVLYDSRAIYVAVINDLPEAGQEFAQDGVSLYVDTSGEGKELLQVTTDAQGTTRCAWIRSNVAVAPREDGSPDIGYPLDIRPDFQVQGLTARAGEGFVDGRAVWTTVFEVPVAGLPALMQMAPAPGGHWKINVLRRVTQGGEQWQSNLSPVYVNAQSVSAYRMAELDFAGR